MAWYYPECDSRSLFFKNLPLKSLTVMEKPYSTTGQNTEVS